MKYGRAGGTCEGEDEEETSMRFFPRKRVHVVGVVDDPTEDLFFICYYVGTCSGVVTSIVGKIRSND